MALKVVCDNKIPFLPGVLESSGVQCVYLPGAGINADAVKDADALIVRTRTKCNAELLNGAKVKFIATATIGFDHLDTEYLKTAGIHWQNAPGCNAGSVVQYVLSVLAALKISGGTLGIIGAGNVGGRLGQAAEKLGFKVLLNDPPRAEREGNAAFTELPDLLAKADVVSMHVPLNATTRNLANQEFFAAMKPGGVFINTSRGEAVDEAALKSAIAANHFSAVCLDVWQNEPDIDLALLSQLKFGTMHIAGYSQDGKANATAASVRGLAEFFNIAELKEFKVNNLPEPTPSKLTGRQAEDWQAAVLSTYNVADDDAELRLHPEKFEYLRGNYRIRREFPAYTTDNFGLTAIGFKN